MKDVWKEFFSLKKREIWSFVCVLPKVALATFCLMVSVLVLFAAIYVVGYITALIANGLFDFDSIMGYGSCSLLGLLCGFLIIYATIKWLKSNWKQAKENVEDRNERPKTA